MCQFKKTGGRKPLRNHRELFPGDRVQQNGGAINRRVVTPPPGGGEGPGGRRSPRGGRGGRRRGGGPPSGGERSTAPGPRRIPERKGRMAETWMDIANPSKNRIATNAPPPAALRGAVQAQAPQEAEGRGTGLRAGHGLQACARGHGAGPSPRGPGSFVGSEKGCHRGDQARGTESRPQGPKSGPPTGVE